MSENSNYGSSSSSSCRTAQSIRRIMREFDEIKANKNPYWTASPINEEEPYEWHFSVRGPVGTEFEGGIYHGKIVLPQNYPLAPPSFTLLNQNGRFEVGRKVCLSASNYHPELWQPAWGLRTMLDALHAFFATPSDGAVHSLNWPVDVRRKLAEESQFWKCPICRENNITLISKHCQKPTAIRPALPSSMIPLSVARSCPYLSSNTDFLSPDESTTNSLSNEDSPEIIPQLNNEGETSENSEEQRRRRRARIEGRPSRSGLTLSELYHIFILSPLSYLISYLFDPSVRSSEKSLVVIDAVSVILLLSTVFLVADLILHPASLGNAFLLDGYLSNP